MADVFIQALRLRRAPSLALLVPFGLAALYLSWVTFRWGDADHHLLLGNVLYLLPSLAAAAVMMLTGFRQQGRARRGWFLIGLGFGAQFLGDGIWAYLEVVAKTEPVPSVADIFYLLMAPLLALGLFQLLRIPPSRSEALRLSLDLAITVGAVGLYFWRFLLAPPLGWGETALATLVTLAYPSLDLLLLGLLLLLLLREGEGELPRRAFFLMGLGLAAQVAADISYNTVIAEDSYYSGHPVDLLWLSAMLLFTLATRFGFGSAPRSNLDLSLPEALVPAIPYLAVASGFGFLLVTQADPAVRDTLGGRGVLYGAVLVTLLVVLRQLLALSENSRLTRHLEGQSRELRALSETLEQKVHERTAELEILSQRFRHDALHDALTGLANRAHFQQALAGVVARKQPFAVLYLDFDRFKTINDSFGHAVGDALLVAISRRLETSLRPHDLVARLGGDEFAVLLYTAHEAEVVRLAERLISAFTSPLQAERYTLTCSASIGVVQSQRTEERAQNVLRDADIAMYQAKALGKSRYALFVPDMREAVQERLTLESDLRKALERGNLAVYYQPIVRATDRSISGFEALARWPHPERGLIAPATFVPLAEETGLIAELDRWVLRTACTQLAAWRSETPDLTLSVNLSCRQFEQPDFTCYVATVLAETGVRAEHLALELTESLLIDSTPAVQASLEALKGLGVRLHIDDFGTGYSSLSYLQRFDADLLKVDRSFVGKMLDSRDSAELVRTIVHMAHNLEMQVVAEGVECEAQFMQLKKLGCSYMQGYLFAKPLLATEAERLLLRRELIAAS